VSDGSPYKILIADDDEEARNVLRDNLTRLEHEIVAECATGREVVTRAQSAKPDVMVLDIKMPGMDGIEAAKQVESTWPCAVVFVTGYIEDQLIEEAGEAGAIAYIVKPYRREEIQAAVQIAVRRFRDLQKAGTEVADLKKALETRKLLDRAKAHLMNSKEMGEEEAFKYIHFGARNTSRTMREVAIEILREAGLDVPVE